VHRGRRRDCGVVVYTVTAQRAGEEAYQAVMSSTFVRREGAWKLAFHQQTPAIRSAG
jgi:hypothetical protein